MKQGQKVLLKVRIPGVYEEYVNLICTYEQTDGTFVTKNWIFKHNLQDHTLSIIKFKSNDDDLLYDEQEFIDKYKHILWLNYNNLFDNINDINLDDYLQEGTKLEPYEWDIEPMDPYEDD
jgi:hypothetical protein